MFLAFSLSDIIQVPFGFLLQLLYSIFNNYGVALIFFAVAVQLVLLPINAKARKSMMKMTRLTPRIQALQKKYENDQAKQQEAVAQLYKEEGVAMSGGCLWSFVPLLIMFPLYSVIREPLKYMMGLGAEEIQTILDIIKAGAPALFEGNSFYAQMIAAANIPQFADAIRTALPDISEAVLEGFNFGFLGLDLGTVPNLSFISNFTWANFGLFLIPVLSAGSQVLSTWITQKMNDSVVTNKDGVQDKETAKKSQSAQTSKMMMWTMPLMSLWIGFTVVGALSLYWLVQGIISMIINNILTVRYRKIYDAEDAIRLEKALAREAEEAEKERIRAQRRAENPDGITENTSKKKLQQKQKAEEAAAKAAAKREYNAKRGIVEEEQEEASCMSGIPERPFCKGRNYDPNRYSKRED